MQVADIHFAGIATADTEFVEAAEAVEQGRYDADHHARGGLASVAVAGATPAPDLAVQAAQRAVGESGHARSEFGGLLHTNVHPQGPDGWSAQHYINRNSIDQPVISVEIRNGCVGFFTGLHLAACFLRAAAERPAVLLTSADNFGTPAVDRWKAAPRLFVLGDGGGAVVLSRRSGFARLLAIASASDPGLEGRHRSGEPLFPPGLTRGGTLNFAERLEHYRRAQEAAGASDTGSAGSLLFDVVEGAMKDADVSFGEIARVVHDGYTIDAVRDLYLEPFGFGLDQGVWEHTRHYGHTGPVDQIRGLEHLWRSGGVRTGEKVLMLSDAPGMEASCAVVEITADPK